MRPIAALLFPLAALALVGCAADIHGSDQEILVRTVPPMAASCLMENSRGSWDLNATPEHIDISRARGPLHVVCHNPLGFRGEAVAGATVDNMTVVGALATGALGAGIVLATAPHAAAGSVLGAAAGGAVGSVAYDSLTGSAWHYPPELVVPMVRVTEAPPDAPARAIEVAPAPVRAAVVRPQARRVVRHHAAPKPSCGCSTAGHHGS